MIVFFGHFFVSICVTHHLVATTDKNGDGTRVGALLDHEHVVFGRAKVELAHNTRLAELLGRELAETRHDTATSGDSDELLGNRIMKYRGFQVETRDIPRFRVRPPIEQRAIRAATTNDWPRRRSPIGK